MMKATKSTVRANNTKVTSETVGTQKKKAKEKEELIKVVLRRLPRALTQDELLEQLNPLPEHKAFWFCSADPDMPPPFAFSRAYIAIRDENDAIEFAKRFNGYVFVDKQGNESMAIVECAANQQVPKDLDKKAKECDIRSGTLESEVQYLKFLEQYKAAAEAGCRRVTDFDELVRELEEKKRRQEEGQVQETPLTAFITRMASEKYQKKAQKANERLEKKILLRLSLSSGAAAKEDRQKQERKQQREQTKQQKGQQIKQLQKDQRQTRQQQREQSRQQQREQQKEDHFCKQQQKDQPPPKQQKQREQQPMKPRQMQKEKDQPNEQPRQQRPSTGGPTASAADKRRNKDRPEREIYRPGCRGTVATRLQQKQQRPAAGTENDCQDKHGQNT